MRLITQPEDGLAPLLRAIRGAKRAIDIVVFRLDLEELLAELEAAVKRGVIVCALVAHTNRGGDKRLRRLEMRMLKEGLTVGRTKDDLVRYHGKLLVVDRRQVYILGFNYTKSDLKSRSFGVQVRSKRIVDEVLRLFESDVNRTPYTPRVRDLVVSPENARRRLEAFLRKARTSIDIYDPQVSDDGMLSLLARRLDRGVKIRILGKLEKKWTALGFEARPFPGKRLHVRAIVRDGRRAFIGSQSLRKLELDKRREVGLIIRDRDVVRRLQKIFDRDWRDTKAGEGAQTKAA